MAYLSLESESSELARLSRSFKLECTQKVKKYRNKKFIETLSEVRLEVETLECEKNKLSKIKALEDDKCLLSHKVSQLKSANKTYEKDLLVQISFVDSLGIICHRGEKTKEIHSRGHSTYYRSSYYVGNHNG